MNHITRILSDEDMSKVRLTVYVLLTLASIALDHAEKPLIGWFEESAHKSFLVSSILRIKLQSYCTRNGSVATLTTRKLQGFYIPAPKIVYQLLAAFFLRFS